MFHPAYACSDPKSVTYDTFVDSFYPEGDDVPLVNPKLEDGGLTQNVHQLPFSTGRQVSLGVPRHLFKCEGWTDPYIPNWETIIPREKNRKIFYLTHTLMQPKSQKHTNTHKKANI